MNCYRGTFIALFLAVLAAIPPAQADDVLKYRVTTQEGRAYCYWKFSSAARTIQPGDCVEYDVYVNTNAAGVGGIEVRNTDGSYWRDLGYADQNGLSGHPGENLTSRAYRKWYHRKLPVPAAVIGKTTSWWDVVLDGNYGIWECHSAIYDNVRITNGGVTVLNVYADGAPSLNQQDFVHGSSVQSAHLLAGPVRMPGIQVSAHFFYWHDAPNGNADPSQMVYDPHGVSTTGPWSGYGYGSGYSGYYSTMNTAWWEGALQDAKAAGVDIVDLICWGNHPYPWFQFSVISNYLVPALERSGVGIKIALFDDTSSECCEWNAANGRGYTVSPPMPLSDSANWTYFYDLKIKPFFQRIPQKFWATHNGLPVEQGGRPIIYTYAAGFFSNVDTHGTSLWQEIKNSFARDFKDANGSGITPFVIHEKSWTHDGFWPWEPDYDSAADSIYQWGAALNGPNINGMGGYYACEIGPGYDDRIIRTPGNYADRQRQVALTSWYNGAYGGRRVWDTSILTMETWNELWEGTAIDRCVNYPDPWAAGTYLPETFYIDTFHNLVQSSIGIRDYDATFLRTWEIPASVISTANTITVKVRNDGLLPWQPGTHSLGGRLLDAATRSVMPGTERVLAGVPTEVLGGAECSITFAAPVDWPAGSYILQLDMMQGATWFSSLGDTPVTKSIVLDLTVPTGSIAISSGAEYTAVRTVTLALSAADTGSGVAWMRFAEGGSPFGNWETYAASKTWTLATGDGTKTVSVQFKDAAGNISSTYGDSIILDMTRPTGTITINSGAQYTTSTGVNLTLSASDSGSGVSQMRFANSGSPFGAWEAYATSKTLTLSTGDGTKTVYVQFKDGAGNINSGNYNDSIILDTAAPSIPGTPTDIGAYTTNTSLIFNWTASGDTGSGIAGYNCQVGTAPGAADKFSGYLGNVLITTVGGCVNGSAYYCRVQAKDNAGNLSAWSAASDGISVVQHSGISIAQAKALADSESVGLASKRVTAIFDSYFYVEDTNRSAGIKIVPTGGTPSGLAVGVLVDVGGVMRTNSDRERWIDATVSVKP